MTTDNKSTSGEEVKNDQTTPTEVVKSGLSEQEVINDMFNDSSPAQQEESTVTDDSAKAEDTEGKSEEEPKEDESKESESYKKEEEEKDEKPTEEKPETKSDEEPYAAVGGRKFKTKEELTEFTNSQVGYNTWLTGNLKKIRPDLFNADGTIKSKELQEAVTQKAKTVEEAAQTVADLQDKKPEDITDEDKEEYERARKILKPLGVVFSDDPEFQALRKHNESQEQQELQSAQERVQAFEKEHPLIANYRNEVADIIERNGYDLEKAWKVCKVAHDIVEEPVKKTDVVTKKAADSAVPVTTKKESGNLPPSGQKDFMDDIISATVPYSR